MEYKTKVTPMTVHDKARLLVGEDFWYTASEPDHEIPALMLTDGPLGLRKQISDPDNLGINDSAPATCFPSASATACSFDRDLLHDIGRAMGEECLAQDVSVILSPAMNIKRSPLCGRNFEYFSEDPLLSGEMAAAQISGIQSMGVGASPKHFAGNNQEKNRMISDSVIDERALHEIYLRGFEIAVRKSRPATIMGAYNRLNGTYCCQNETLLQDILRDAWGFQGAVITDWGAMVDDIPSFEAGLDLAMPGPRDDVIKDIEDAVASGELSHDALNRAAAAMLDLINHQKVARMNLQDPPQATHLDMARRAAEESAVLLENDGILPLDPDDHEVKYAVIGAFAKQPRYQGAGSSKINPVSLDCAWDALTEAGLNVEYAEGYDRESGDATEEQLAEAEALAAKSDVVLLFIGLPGSYESEGYDRTSFQLPEGHTQLIERVCNANARTAAIMTLGAPVEVPWRKQPAALLLAYLPGCQGGHAIFNLLFGHVNPSGKLAETWPESISDTALSHDFPDLNEIICYRESIYVGYRYLDAVHFEPAYPFGFGRSYSDFAYQGLNVEVEDGLCVASCEIENTSLRDGREIVQVYVQHPHDDTSDAGGGGVFMAPQALAGFEKVMVRAGETVKVRIPLDPCAFGYWDRSKNDWRIDTGSFTVAVSASSRDHRLSQEITLREGDRLSSPIPGQPDIAVYATIQIPEEKRITLNPYYQVIPGQFQTTGQTDAVMRHAHDAFMVLYGRDLPKPLPKRPYSMQTVVQELTQSRVGRFVLKIVSMRIEAVLGTSEEDTHKLMNSMMDDFPLRTFIMGGANAAQVEGLIEILNGHYFKGIKELLESGQGFSVGKKK